MLAFTKGKWVYADVSTPYEQNFIIGTLDPNGVFFAHGSARNEADARLSVAAPDMYRTLVKILDDTQNGQFADENELIALLNSIDEENREFNPMYPIP